MTTLLEIERAIEQLPSDQFSKIYDWIVEKDWRAWDAQIERDSADGKLDFLVDEALQDAKSGVTRPL
jgi:aminopeptidase-like protein